MKSKSEVKALLDCCSSRVDVDVERVMHAFGFKSNGAVLRYYCRRVLKWVLDEE